MVSRARLTVAALMIMVAIFGIGFFGQSMMRRRAYHLKQAAHHESRVAEWVTLSERNRHPDREMKTELRQFVLQIKLNRFKYEFFLWELQVMADRLKNRDALIRKWESQVAAQKANAEYFRKLVAHDLYAARRPWLPVEPDPPMPE